MNVLQAFANDPDTGGAAVKSTANKKRRKVEEALKALLKQIFPITSIPCGN